jgi:hypothetical protein
MKPLRADAAMMARSVAARAAGAPVNNALMSIEGIWVRTAESY